MKTKWTGQLFIDIDGVMGNFDKLATKLYGSPVSVNIPMNDDHALWSMIEQHENFFGSLELMPDAMELFNAVKHLHPVFLTGLPKSSLETNWADKQKRAWVEKHFPGSKVITCLSKDKSLHMQPGDILIDDWDKYQRLWELAGGTFILHKSAKQSIKELKRLGVLEGQPASIGSCIEISVFIVFGLALVISISASLIAISVVFFKVVISLVLSFLALVFGVRWLSKYLDTK